MPVTATILKKTPQQAVVRVNGNDATAVVTLASLATTGQSPEGAAVRANIRGLKWAVATGGRIVITRAGIVLYDLGPGSDSFEFNGFADTIENDESISVAITGQATLFLDISKPDGFGDAAHRNQIT